ncbi:MAG TPA: hypothetical protein DCK83_07005 [Gallionellaceae bacterium]|nr:hypothetical protein [Gallionellaceae bacterium]
MDTQVARVVELKPWYKSRTLWVNLLSAIGIVLEVKYEAIKPLVSPEIYQWLAILIPVANTALRVVTTAPLMFGLGRME